MTTETITEQGRRHGSEFADHYWQLDPADHEQAMAWCCAAEDGTLTTDYDLPPDAADAIPGDLDTAGWSWGELADYQAAWADAYYERTTELCCQVLGR